MRVKIIIEKEENGQGYHAYCPALKGCHSCGDTLKETKKNIKEAIALYLEPEEKEIERQIKLHKTLHPIIMRVAV